MGICPVCNGLEEKNFTCSTCGSELEEAGRLMDFFDDYSAYMPIDLMKLEDGYPEDYAKGLCPHLYKCPSCDNDVVQFIQE